MGAFLYSFTPLKLRDFISRRGYEFGVEKAERRLSMYKVVASSAAYTEAKKNLEEVKSGWSEYLAALEAKRAAEEEAAKAEEEAAALARLNAEEVERKAELALAESKAKSVFLCKGDQEC